MDLVVLVVSVVKELQHQLQVLLLEELVVELEELVEEILLYLCLMAVVLVEFLQNLEELILAVAVEQHRLQEVIQELVAQV